MSKEMMEGYTKLYRMDCGNVYATYDFDPDTGKPAQVFMRIGKSGACQGCMAQAVARTISIALQEGVDPGRLGKTLAGIKCPGGQPGEAGTALSSCLDGLGRELLEIAEGR